MRGEIIYDSKPDKVITNAGIGLFKAYKFLKNYSTWPVDGGVIKQTSKFIKAIEYMDGINSQYEKWEKIQQDAINRNGK